jgi:hypothetical protein
MDRDAQQAKGQQDEPNNRVENQCSQRERPADDEQEAPE